MTVKGNNMKLQSEEITASNQKNTNYQNGSGPAVARSPPKDSNLNHYRPEKSIPPVIQPSQPVATDNRKERNDRDHHHRSDRDRDKERDKRSSVSQAAAREPSPLDHRGETASLETKGKNSTYLNISNEVTRFQRAKR